MKRSYNLPKKTVYLAFMLLIIVMVGVFFVSQSSFMERFTNPPDATLEYYFMKKCPHCVDFNSVWDKLGAKLKSEDYNIEMKKYDLQEKANGEKISQNNVSGAPTIIMVSKGKSVEFNGARSLDALVKFVSKNL
jgi:glutaredoxin